MKTEGREPNEEVSEVVADSSTQEVSDVVTDPMQSMWNRKTRRLMQRQFGYMPRERQRIQLASTDAIIEHDEDVVFYEQELTSQRKVQRLSQQILEMMRTSSTNLLEDLGRTGMIEGKLPEAKKDFVTRIQKLPQGERIRFTRKLVPIVQGMDIIYKDEDEIEFFQSFKGVDLPFAVILEEATRLRQERIDLLSMQIAWLETNHGYQNRE